MDIEMETAFAKPGAYARPDLIRRFGRADFDTAVAAGRLVAVARGIYASPLHAQSVWTSAQALVIACGGDAALTGRAALAARQCIREAPDRALVVTTSPRRVRRAVGRVRLLRTVHPFPSLVINDVPVATADTALVHAVGETGPDRARACALEALSSGIVDVGAVAQMVQERRFRGQRVLREALASFDVGVRSILEHEAASTVLTGPAFAHLVRQHSITVLGRRMDIDAYDHDLRLAFELDGASFHSSPSQQQRDRERDTLLASVGIQTVRFTTHDVRRRPQWCRQRALEICEQRRRLLESVTSDQRSPEIAPRAVEVTKLGRR